ncbi:AraC family transcriptional regulator [Acinetobacter rudis]|uniref:Helix-turn-helix transcriptional regulator n=1 Tax=Acinetobacter rudis TaxID=632955 RepID=A0AAW8JBP6_9GAMM|nr:helix-turn-helix transcriptional regulator [Acinetobacter rudis]MDQ8935109.1 helix-turn-helix transcriptional regulator [Acinetobacter rudis]MDQ9016977.1 helix-turn-helix transcriptional regulator [Acinetobacter rudis]
MTTALIHGYSDYEVFAFAQGYTHGHVENWHQHPHIQLIHTLTGVMRVETAEGIWICPPGRGLWIPAGKQHALHVSGQGNIRGVWIEANTHLDLATHCSVVNISALLRELICAALEINNKIEPNSRNERLLQLILDEVRLLPSLAFHLPEAQSPALIQLCRKIRDNLAFDWKLEHAATITAMSSKTLSRRFQKELNMNFAQWIRQAKLLQAMTELSLHKPILHIALDLGYDSPSAFSAMFKRETAMTPSEYMSQFQANG